MGSSYGMMSVPLCVGAGMMSVLLSVGAGHARDIQ